MQPFCFIDPRDRSWQSRLRLIWRLWRKQVLYGRNCPSSLPVGRRVKLHFAYLQLYWSRVVDFQKAVGLEEAYFQPCEPFEYIWVVMGRTEKDLPTTAMDTVLDRWKQHKILVGSLSYELNPYEFSEICGKCYRLVREMNHSSAEEEKIIPLETTHLARA